MAILFIITYTFKLRIMIERKNKDINIKVVWFIAFAAILFKLLLAYGQYVTIYPPLAPIDDDLMFKAAQNIAAGNWLGEYGWLTISKHMFFAVWLAFLHIVKVPYMVGNMALWAFASFIVVIAVKPVLSKNWQKLFLFLGMLYNPAMSARYATRIYRDAIFPSLCLLFIAGVVGVGLRYKEKTKKWIVWLIIYGLAFGCIYLCREDGMWIIPFFVAAYIIVIGLLIYEKNKDALAKGITMLIPFILSIMIIAAYSYMNYTHYGRFIVSDFTSSEFKTAFGALTSLEQDEWHPLVSVPEDVREDVYRISPAFAMIEDNIKSDWIENSWRNLHDFSSGSFYWAMRESVAQAGYYENAQTAQQYYQQLTQEIQTAVNDGRLKTVTGNTKLRKSVTPPIKLEYVPDVLAETFAGFKTVMLFEQCTPYAEKAVGYPEEIQEVEAFIHQTGDTGYVPGTDVSYISPGRKAMHSVLEVFVLIYKTCIPVMFFISLLWQIKKLRQDIFAKTFDIESMLNIVLIGLLGMALLRCAMIAFVEVASFNIGTYIMYLSTVHPLIILYSFIGFNKTFEN